MAADPRFAGYLQAKRALVEAALDRALPPETEPPASLHQALRYAVFGVGKRLRPVLVLAAGMAVGGRDDDALLPAACAVEVLHTYSLVHDDLPAMDDDDYRRGRPTCHKVYGEANAILAGDALLTLAFELLAQAPVPPERVARAVSLLAARGGSRGLVGGQTADLEAEGKPCALPALEFIHRNKTGQLITACVELGGVLAGGSGTQVAALTAYGRAAGHAFQVIDDVLDEILTTEELGKDAGSDRKNEKCTYATLLGLDGARAKAEELVAQAEAALDPLGEPAWALRAMVDHFAERMRRGRERSLQPQ